MTLPILPTIALSVRQPWAWAIIHAGKDIENRTTHAVTKGDMSPREICIHASKGMTQYDYESARDFMRISIGVTCPTPDELVRGGIIGAVTVDAVVKDHDSPWFFGPRGLVLSGAREVIPFPVLGKLGYFYWRRGGALDEPKPWMKSWPERPTRKRTAPADKSLELSLFEDGAA